MLLVPLAFVLTALQAIPQSLPTETIHITTADGTHHTFTVEIADEAEERRIGMMGREHVAPDEGMLFLFFDNARRSFWMKDTYVPLDIIFIRANGRILNIAHETEPLSEASVPSAGPAVAVLELAGGRAAELGLAPGDMIHHWFFGTALAESP